MVKLDENFTNHLDLFIFRTSFVEISGLYMKCLMELTDGID